MTPIALLIDDELPYRRQVVERLKGEWEVFDTDSVEQALEKASDARVKLIILDNRGPDVGSYWQQVLPRLRQRNPTAWVLLVSQLSEAQLQHDVKLLTGDAEQLLKTDPWVSYLPKIGTDHEHLDTLVLYANNLRLKHEHRRRLQKKILEAAIESAKQLHNKTIKELSETAIQDGKADTKVMDIITEGCIHNSFLPEMHYANVVICTEERGIHNRLFHRIQNPDYFIFSDPFDGSSAFKVFAESLKGKNRGDETLAEVVMDSTLMQEWEKMWGARELNSPMVSIVLAEKHAVFAAVLINLFTYDIYASIDSGNWCRQLNSFDDSCLNELFPENVDGARKADGWVRMEFNSCSKRKGKERLILCTLGAKKKQAGRESKHYNAAVKAIRPILPGNYSWDRALDERVKQGDFTPGPGRILFLSDCAAARKYYEKQLPQSRYECIAAAGEPLTEWMGWFAFLRHIPQISAFSLRKQQKDGSISNIQEKRTPEDPSSMMPDEVVSIFRDGFIDISVLHSAYRSKMRLYNDTFIVVWDEDEEWRKQLFDPDKGGRFVAIPLHNQLAK